MAGIKQDYLPPLDTGATITDADRGKVYEVIARRLGDLLTGNQSYYPEGLAKGSDVQLSDLNDFIDSLIDMQSRVNDPSNILGFAIEKLKNHADNFKHQIDGKDSGDQIELSPALSPTTRDNRVIYVDPFPNRFSPPNPLSPKNWPKDSYATLNGSPANAMPNDNSRPLDGRLGTGGSGDALRQSGAQPQPSGGLPGLYSGRPMRQYVVPPPIFGQR